MSEEHLAACSSLTTDGMLSQLDKMLWNHENSYLYEKECMSEQNARDTQFQGFAKSVVEELTSLELEYMGVTIDNLSAMNRYYREEWEEIIARRAFDLVKHTIVELSCQDAINFRDPDFDKYEYRASEMVEVIPDMTELPKEECG